MAALDVIVQFFEHLANQVEQSDSAQAQTNALIADLKAELSNDEGRLTTDDGSIADLTTKVADHETRIAAIESAANTLAGDLAPPDTTQAGAAAGQGIGATDTTGGAGGQDTLSGSTGSDTTQAGGSTSGL